MQYNNEHANYKLSGLNVGSEFQMSPFCPLSWMRVLNINRVTNVATVKPVSTPPYSGVIQVPLNTVIYNYTFLSWSV